MAFLYCFVIILFSSIIFKFSILYSMYGGLILFTAYGLTQGFNLRSIGNMYLKGIYTARKILTLLLLLGLMTSMWRSSGTISYIVNLAYPYIRGKSFYLITFLLNALISTITGTAFGTSATVGSICMAINYSLGLNAELTGGAILSGVYFGNRISPVSSIALLTSSVTNTNIYSNLRKLLPLTLVSLLISSIIYYMLGVDTSCNVDYSIREVFLKEFTFSPLLIIIPLGSIVLAILQVPIYINLLISTGLGLTFSLLMQNYNIRELIDFMIYGYKAHTQGLESLKGGGLVSMKKVFIIVLIASMYGGIFKETDIMEPVKKLVYKLSLKTKAYLGSLVTSILTSCVCCNQTLTIILTCEFCPKHKDLSLHLYNSAVVVAPLIPWSVACTTALSSAGCPLESVKYAFFLFIVPILCLIESMISSD